jgi:hypothetical protein
MFDSTQTTISPLAPFALHSFDVEPTATTTRLLAPQEWASESDAGLTVIGLPEREPFSGYNERRTVRLVSEPLPDMETLQITLGLAYGALLGAAFSFAGYVALLAW